MFFKSRRFVIGRVVLVLALFGGMLDTARAHAFATTVTSMLPLIGETILVSVDSNDNQSNGSSYAQSISADGRYIAFNSDATNLVPETTGGLQDVFVHDLQTGLTTLASVDSSGKPGNGYSYYPSISGDGRYVAFHSSATNLTPDDTNASYDVFVHDLQTQITTRVSVNSSGTQANGISHDAAISADGRFVGFTSGATNLVAADSNGVDDVFVHDMVTGMTTRVSVDSNGVQANDASRHHISLSANGRYIVFQSGATNLVPGDTNGQDDVFMHDIQTGATKRISVDLNGVQGNNGSFYPSISGDGRFIAFGSAASNLVSGDSNGVVDVFMYNVQAALTMRVSVDSNGVQGNDDSSLSSISADGRYVAFQSAATNLVSDDTNSVDVDDAFVYDTQLGRTTRVSIASDGSQANGFLNDATISADGQYIAFFSAATNLVSGDTNDKWDVFVHRQEILPLPTPLVRYVKWDATGANNGTSWTNAYTDLQSALAVASNGDEIWVAAGTYTPTLGTDRTISFTLKNGVAVYGGFAGTETSRAQRKYETNVTVLSGDIGTQGNNSDNSYHVVIGSSTDSSTILDGFTVTAGNANQFQLDTGGGMLNHNGSPTLRNILFNSNSGGLGGGMYNGGDPGFPLPSNGSNPTLENVVFSGNSAIEGGGMENQFNSSPTLTNVVFSNNTAERSGGGMINYDHSSPILLNITFNENTASMGGGIENYDGCNPSLTNVTFYANSVSVLSGGGMLNYRSSPTITNATFYGNIATQYGGAIYNEGNSNSILVNVTLNGNAAAIDGGGIYNDSGTATIHNSILYGNSGGEITGTATVTYSIIQGGYAGIGNLSAEPKLGALAHNGGFTQTMALSSDSPAINAGDDANCPETDQRGMSRPQGSHCDIGAYEYRSTPAIYYVKQGASGVNNGSSWTNAYTNLQSALAIASNGDEIWVAAGTYKPTTGMDRTISFTLKNGVAIYGGFAGTESLLSERDYAKNITILSGDIGAANNNSDNSYHVVVASSVDNNTILDGFTITGGNANGVSPYNGGGGMYSDKGSPRLNSIIFTNNYAAMLGGGLYAFNTDEGQTVNLDLTGVVFSNNTAGGNGGGMSTSFYLLPSASYSANLTSVTFTNNVAGRVGGGMDNNGGNLTLLDVTFSGNTALGGGGLSNAPYPSSILTNVTFSNNLADEGGGGMLVGSDGQPTTLTNVTFNHNSSAINGGGIVNAGYSHLILANVTFSDNTAGANGGGIFNGEFAAVKGGGTVNLVNTTFSHNVSNIDGSAIYNEIGNVNIHNSIMYGDPGGEIYGTTNVTYSIVQGGYTGIGNLDADPLLGQLQDNGGSTQTMALLSGSPAINAGDDANCPETDQRGVERPQGIHCDIGAYEYVSTIYDDTDSHWSYTGTWKTYSGSGPYNNTLHYTGTIGNTARFMFTGTQFILSYTQHTNRGSFEVYVDGGKIATINANGVLQWQKNFTSPIFATGMHVVQIKNIGGSGSIIDVDAIEILDTPIPHAGKYDDNENWFYSGKWLTYTGSGPYNSSLHYAATVGNTASFTFSGTQFILSYTQSTNRGSFEVYVDGNRIATINAHGVLQWQKTFTSPIFAAGTHVVQFKNIGGSGSITDVDSIEILDTPIPGAGKYDDNENWFYTGTWLTFSGSGPYKGTLHYTRTVGNMARFTFSGTQFTLTYTQNTNRGKFEVYVDGKKIATINANGILQWQKTYTSPTFAAGTHVVQVKNIGGTGSIIDVDAIEIN